MGTPTIIAKRQLHYFAGLLKGLTITFALPRLMPSWSWDRLVGEGEGRARLDSQYWRANVAPSERYVLAAPGTSKLS